MKLKLWYVQSGMAVLLTDHKDILKSFDDFKNKQKSV